MQRAGARIGALDHHLICGQADQRAGDRIDAVIQRRHGDGLAGFEAQAGRDGAGRVFNRGGGHSHRFQAVHGLALAMAQGARERTGADYALSVTGFADGDQAGHVYVGLATAGHVHARKLKLSGDRLRVRTLTVLNALDWLRRSLI